MEHSYKPSGICAYDISFDIEDNKVKNLKISGGCQGNHLGISALVEGMDVDEVIKRLKGITCGRKTTSCPDQVARALEGLKEI